MAKVVCIPFSQDMSNDEFRQFRFSIDLLSLNNPQFQPQKTSCSIYFSPFGQEPPYTTTTAVVGFPTSEYRFLNSFQAWEFVSSNGSLQDILEKHQIDIKLRVHDFSGKVWPIAISHLDPSDVFDAQPFTWTESDNTNRPRYASNISSRNIQVSISDKHYDMFWLPDATSAFDRAIAKSAWAARLRVVLALEDFGSVGSFESIPSNPQNVSLDYSGEASFDPLWSKEKKLAYLAWLKTKEKEWVNSVKGRIQKHLSDRLLALDSKLKLLDDMDETLQKFYEETSSRKSNLFTIEKDMILRTKLFHDRMNHISADVQHTVDSHISKLKNRLQLLSKRKEFNLSTLKETHESISKYQASISDMTENLMKLRSGLDRNLHELKSKHAETSKQISIESGKLKILQGSCRRYKYQWQAIVGHLEKLRETVEKEALERTKVRSDSLVKLRLYEEYQSCLEDAQNEQSILCQMRKKLDSIKV